MTRTTQEQIAFAWGVSEDDPEELSVGPRRKIRVTWQPCVRFARLQERLGLNEVELLELLVRRAEKGLDAGEWGP